ncbi:hypothetical protein GF326_07445 [Candidatus Bathyarchaeota archaeon]|nr:hypothetical protein [Candidatus Bathyarchaeota archaeon]
MSYCGKYAVEDNYVYHYIEVSLFPNLGRRETGTFL